jgi:histidyl-tRNA synthetase
MENGASVEMRFCFWYDKLLHAAIIQNKRAALPQLMTSKFQGFPGMDDILPGEIEKWQWVEEKARIFFEAAGFKEIRTPLLEPTELFTRSIGESTDIVHKEMYTFEDRGKRSMTLRPEMTASVARCVVEKGLLTQAKSLRFYYIGPMFRAERPQAGRKRQFHQIGVEIINEAGPAVDAELLRHVHGFFNYLGLKDIKLQLNDLGDPGARDHTRKTLQEYFLSQKNKLCKDCQWRLEKNVLRILDCKEPDCQPVIEKAPWEKALPAGDVFQKVSEDLRAHQIPFEVNRRLVRGLDYYNGIVFEVTAAGLGAQNAVAGGGRYDSLYASLGGKQTPATGFSLGIERLIVALEAARPSLSERICEQIIYFAPSAKDIPSPKGVEIYQLAQKGAMILGDYGFKTEAGWVLDDISEHLKKANKLRAKYVVILGLNELNKKEWQVKSMDKKIQESVSFGKLSEYFLSKRAEKC